MVSGSLSAVEGNEQSQAHCPFSTYTERFYEVLPFYLSIGMTSEQFWDDDPTLTKYYRKAEEIRQERKNQELWLQGMYIYEAICDVSPILHAFAKKGSKPHPYPVTPYALTEKQLRAKQEEKERAIAEKGRRMMDALMAKQKKLKVD